MGGKPGQTKSNTTNQCHSIKFGGRLDFWCWMDINTNDGYPGESAIPLNRVPGCLIYTFGIEGTPKIALGTGVARGIKGGTQLLPCRWEAWIGRNQHQK